MENKVGDKVPSPKVVAEIVDEIKSVNAKLKKFGVTLSVDERKRLLHARREADPMVKRVHELSLKYGVNLPGIPVQGMVSDMTLRDRLLPIVDLLRAALALADDTEGQAESEMWEAFLAHYGVLSSMADKLPELATELAPVVAFMANGKRRKEAPAADGAEETKPA